MIMRYLTLCDKAGSLQVTVNHNRSLVVASLIREQTIEIAASDLKKLHNKPFWIWNVQEHRQEDIRMFKMVVEFSGYT